MHTSLGPLTLFSAVVLLPLSESLFKKKGPGKLKQLNAEADPLERPGITPAFWVRTVVTIAILSAALFVILSRRYAEDQQKWAYGALGTLIGFWLRT